MKSFVLAAAPHHQFHRTFLIDSSALVHQLHPALHISAGTGTAQVFGRYTQVQCKFISDRSGARKRDADSQCDCSVGEFPELPK